MSATQTVDDPRPRSGSRPPLNDTQGYYSPTSPPLGSGSTTIPHSEGFIANYIVQQQTRHSNSPSERGSTTQPHPDEYIQARLDSLRNPPPAAVPRADALIQGGDVPLQQNKHSSISRLELAVLDRRAELQHSPMATPIEDLMRLTSLSSDVRAIVSAPEGLRQPSLDDSAIEQREIGGDISKRVLCVTQSSRTAFFSLEFRGICCDFYYDAAGDGLAITNRGAIPVLVRPFAEGQPDNGQQRQLVPRAAYTLPPGPWRVSTAQGEEQWIDIVLRSRGFVVCKSVQLRAQIGSKRPSHGLLESGAKRARVDVNGGDHRVILCANNSNNNVAVVTSGHPAADLKLGETLTIGSTPGGGTVAQTGVKPGSESYSLVHLRHIALHESCCVFRADHDVWGDLAVKVIRISSSPSHLAMKIAKMWAKEESLMRRIRHSNIVKILESDARLHTIYMEYLPSPDLLAMRNTTVRGRHMFSGTSDVAERVLDDIASALKYLQEQQILHNDIKPGNIIYTGLDRGAVLIDFGLASTPTDPVCNGGTPWYVPEELLQYQRGFKSDVFALGVTLLYLLKKTPAPDLTEQGWAIANVLKDVSQLELMNKWLGKVERLANELLLTGIEAVTKAALERDPNKRISARQILEMRLGRAQVCKSPC
ncbi:hypothetical protein PCL_10541 [Purpureocillium lilacinum]|uniref:Protein kinase domain-containing protein n=1 Tax=Purpureocillium lilacinum TaxID=33203 RepID=A0A2U3DQ44_PURLI|nr:hypothetical protein PCL_10541 [Purpureocillium lilacinum]